MQTIAAGLTILIFAIITLVIIAVIYFSARLIRKRFFKEVEKDEDSILEKTGAIFNHLFKDKKD
jgi:hypothetical protein